MTREIWNAIHQQSSLTASHVAMLLRDTNTARLGLVFLGAEEVFETLPAEGWLQWGRSMIFALFVVANLWYFWKTMENADKMDDLADQIEP